MFPFMSCVAKDIPLCPYFSPHKQKCWHPQLEGRREPRKGARWAAEDCKPLCWNWFSCRDTPPTTTPPPPPPETLMITNILDIRFNVASSSAVSLAVAADTGCIFAGGCVGIAQLGITMVLPARPSRQRWGTAALETSFLSRLPVKAEHLEGRRVLKFGHRAGRTELQL